MSNEEMDQRELREPCAETAFSDIASPLVGEAIERAKTITSDPSAEGLHQLRIIMRRLRSLWWSYRPLLDAGENTRQRDLFRSLADSAGKARDYDILIELLKLQQKVCIGELMRVVEKHCGADVRLGTEGRHDFSV